MAEITELIETEQTNDSSNFDSTNSNESSNTSTTNNNESEPEKRIILIRHAESDWNASGSMERNCKITEYGKNCSKYLDFDVDLVVCSTLRRARETLDNSGIKYKNILFTELCREYLDDNPVNYYNNEEIVPESITDLENRVDSFKELLSELQEKYNRIAVITHYIFLEKMTSFHFKNCHYLNYSIDE